MIPEHDARLRGGISASPALALPAALFLAERERWPLWLPVLFGAGIAGYFALSVEPPAWAGGMALLFASVLAALALRAGQAGRMPFAGVAGIALLIFAGGFVAAQWRTAAVDGPMIARKAGPLSLSGIVTALERREHGWRVTLDDVRLDDARIGAGRRPRVAPETVRLGVRTYLDDVAIGDRVALRAMLLPPSPPVAPGAFDFRRYAFFRGIGAVGYALSGLDVVEAAARDGLAVRLARWRLRLSERILAALPGSAGGVAAALMTGERGSVPAEIMTAVRNSGLAHLLAISGLHMGLVSAVVFFVVRLGLASIERVALRYPIKKWAALAALFAAGGYLAITGATVPTQRAFVMTAIVLLAVMTDRSAISMRNVAWAAFAVLAFGPERLLAVGFQLSFAAVIALVALYESLGGGFRQLRRNGGAVRRALLYLAGVAVTTLVAGLATAPFAAYHFNRFVDYGLVANLLAVPVTAMWVMPWAVAAFALMPLGLESVALAPMGWGIEAIVAVARTVAAWPGAVSLVPAMPEAGLMALALGGLWLCLWRRRWRWAGALVVLAGLASPLLRDPPDIRIDGDGGTVAVRAADGGLLASSRRRSGYALETWLRRDGLVSPRSWPDRGPSSDGRLRCDDLGCIYRAGGYSVSLPGDERALAEDCYFVDVVVSRVPVKGRCPSPRVVVDRFDLWREGAYALWLGKKGVRVVSVASRQGRRPWSMLRGFSSGAAGR